MVNALVVRKVQLPRSEKSHRAAQYVRMSTERQRYSIQNQAAVLAAYAHAHGLTIVRTYRDEGERGLRIKNRAGLRQLIQDVGDGQADFDYLLVYDVSRWGRFQDIDESAHYEFVCKQAGIKVAYCAEQFDNDGSMLSSIMKNLKRVMAAEYSRELSAKVHAGACRFARLGFVMGGQVGYALRRELVDEKLQPKGIMKNGERKYLLTDHIRLRPGTADEMAVVRWIFEQFLRQKSETGIARELNRKTIDTSTGRPWNRALIGRLLRNENYVGNLIYNRRSRKLGEKDIYNPPDLWVRSENCMDPIVTSDVFIRAKKIIKDRRVELPEEQMLARLRRTLMKEGCLSPAIIDKTVGLPCTATYRQHFGSLRNVYRLIGYTSKRNCEYIDARRVWTDVTVKLVSQVAAALEKVGARVACHGLVNCLQVNGRVNITFRVARWCSGEQESHSAHWTIQRQAAPLPIGWIVAIRLGEQNKAVLDYVVLSTDSLAGRLIRFTEKARARCRIDRFETPDALVRSIIRRVTTRSPASQSRSGPPNRRSTSSRSRSKNARALR